MKYDEPPLILTRTLIRNGLVLQEVQIKLLAQLVESVLEWNSKINLISRRDVENIWFCHVLHSLSLLFYVDIPDGYRVLDLGTGGGFPGIPIAIAKPGVRFVLIDSVRKKTTAVQDIVERLALTNVTVLTGRAEELHKHLPDVGRFDLVMARAVASLRDLVRWTRPNLKESGSLVALKGGDLETEIAEAKIKESLTSVRVIRMSFDGSTELGLNDKQVVIVRA